MHKKIKIAEEFDDETLNIALDTLKIKKQALIFLSTKKSAESNAEKIAVKVKDINLEELSEEVRTVLTRPTKQCERLARCVKKGIAFHHSGLESKQRELIENKFRDGTIKIICCTPTLAMGLDMPAFRSVVRDLKRYGGRWGMDWIQVLEYHQMAGRAGRPGKEDYGEAICVASNDSEKNNIITKFIHGEPEDIYSKLAVEPVLRTYILSLVATGFVKNKKELSDFFSKTFWAHQYKDLEKLNFILEKMITLLKTWGFLESDEKNLLDKKTEKIDFKSVSFKSVDSIIDEKLIATKLGEKVSSLYLDPYTANFIITCLKRAKDTRLAKEFSYIHMVSSTLELRPTFKVGVKEYTLVEEKLVECGDDLLYPIPSAYDADYEDFLSTIKTSIIFDEWMNETDEHDLLEKYNVRPGEFKTKLNEADWILFCTTEFARMTNCLELIKDIRKTQVRLEYGAKEELIALLKLKNIGRIRARTLYKNGIKDLGDILKIDFTTLSQLIGQAIAKDIKSQVGADVSNIVVKPNKRKGQMSMSDY